MEAFEVNKTIGAVLSALLVVFASKTVLDIAYKEHKPEKPGRALPITEVVAKSKEPAAPLCFRRRACWRKPTPIAAQDTFKPCRATRHRAVRTARGPILGRGTQAAARGFTGGHEGGKGSGPGMLATYLHDPRPLSPATRWRSPASGMTPSWPTFWPICASSRTRRLPCRSRPPPVDQPAS